MVFVPQPAAVTPWILPNGLPSVAFLNYMRSLDDLVRGLTADAITASLGADVLLNNTGLYFDGPSVAQGTTGTWFVSGTVSFFDTSAAAQFRAKLWDGTTIIASSIFTCSSANFLGSIALSGYITNPVGNIKISVQDATTVNGKIVANLTGNAKDSTISALRIG